MIRKPKAVQRLLHRVFMLKPVTAFFASRVHHIDQGVLALTEGRHTATEILGWNMIQLLTLGARTGQPRRVPLLAVFDGEKIGLIASSFGRKRNPGWYYNLKAHPECQVQWKGKVAAFVAHEAYGDEYKKYWQLGVSYYAGYEKYKERAPYRHIPVMVLEPKK